LNLQKRQLLLGAIAVQHEQRWPCALARHAKIDTL
jgi:hypothetical protein